MTWREQDDAALLLSFLAWLDYQDDRDYIEDETLVVRFIEQRRSDPPAGENDAQ